MRDDSVFCGFGNKDYFNALNKLIDIGFIL
jgi:hypothetical protein